MDKIASFETEFLSFPLKADFFLKGEGIIVEIIGPNDHIGGIGVGFPYIRKNGDPSANSSCISIPSHRDVDLAGVIARKVARTTRKESIAILGMHFPDISPSQIEEFSQFLEQWITEISEDINSVLSSRTKE